MLSVGEVVTSLKVLSVHFQKSESVWVAGRQYHALSLRLSGKIRIKCEGETLISERGCLTFTPQGIGYETEIIEPGEIIVIHFTTIGGLENRLPHLHLPEHAEAMQSQFTAILERYRVGQEQDYTCMSMLYSILALIQHEQRHKESDAIPERMLKARKAIEQRFGDADITIGQLSEQANVSETYFRREFHKYFGVSPGTYLKKTRIENAKLLLSTGYYTVGDVAERCGFRSLSYFSYEFHRLTGQTPTEAMQSE